jgi:hypothetical protein
LTVTIFANDLKQIFKDFWVVFFLDFGIDEFVHKEDYITYGATVYFSG